MSSSVLMDDFGLSIRIAERFAQYAHQFGGIPGYLPLQQGFALLLLAERGPGSGRVVEIGSFCGRSTVFLATGSKTAGRERITAIDHFKGSVEHQSIQGIGNLRQIFGETISRHGVADWVDVAEGDSVEIASHWAQGPIRLLFIDGAHDYESSRRDFSAWSPHVAADGLICFHDVENPHFPEPDSVTRLYREILTLGQYAEVLSVDSQPADWGFLKVVQRCRA